MSYPGVVREMVLARVAGGESGFAVARETGSGHASVRRWAKLAGMSFQVGRLGGVPGASEHRRKRPLQRIEPQIEEADWVDPRGCLTREARVVIEVRLRDGWSQSRIAAALGVHRSTVSREVRRVPGRYRARPAQRARQAAARRPRPSKLGPGTPLRREVITGLSGRYSPEQIAGRLKRQFPDRQDMWVSHETIYQALYVQGAGALRHELTVEKALRSGRKSRKPQSKLVGARVSSRSWIGPDTIITARPVEAHDRAVPGHWEGDLVIGRDSRSALITLNERASRFTLISRLDTHDSVTVTDRLQEMIQRLPAAAFKTLTWDQGVEMARHAQFTIASGIPVFFCDPHSPWQRPTNENGNGLIRDFFPKGTDFTTVTDQEIAEMETLLNNRPRKVLNFATPAETLQQILNVAPTT